MGQSFTIYPVNILERGTVSVSGTTDAAYPATRLHDRTAAFFWQATATEAKTFHVDQGTAGILPVDILAVGLNNFSGKAMQWQFSDDDAGWTDAVADWTPTENAALVKTLSTSLSHRYWRLTLASTANPRCSEIFIGPGYTFDIQRAPGPSANNVSNVQWNRSVGGIERSTRFGRTRRSRSYTVFLDESGLARFDEAVAFLDEFSKPFFFRDHTGSYYWARLDADPYYDFDHKTHVHLTLNFLEML
ncbi:hypothetical protein DSCO28_07310 [Desulfosarcina ovata subsp. sediminis]|uniref:F5/8 type C domain-containing protein n=1 Tax=Desulfosarcina ovata subsp. sediminis TaxID=885957 RepID=A0A5K7ZIY7_9BACT|nr:hypothetical protein [Desulfosarcina ovata]BBO80165.1 hypothetical protein DSCO28_07310 [Desulfosarcina ovata subsp. sediminis]